MKYKKKIIAGMLAFLISVCSLSDTVSAEVPYSSPWGKFYRDPEYQNSFGRCWYQSWNKNMGFNIYLECYYSNGSNTSIKYTYKSSGRNYTKTVSDSHTVQGYSSCSYTKDVSGTFVRCEVHGAGRGISVDKMYR